MRNHGEASREDPDAICGANRNGEAPLWLARPSGERIDLLMRRDAMTAAARHARRRQFTVFLQTGHVPALVASLS